MWVVPKGQIIRKNVQGINLKISTLDSIVVVELEQQGCLTLVINCITRTSKLTHLVYQTTDRTRCHQFQARGYGSKLLHIVDAINRMYNVTACSTEDFSTVGGDYLSMLYFLQHGLTWYASKGYIRNDEASFLRRAGLFVEEPLYSGEGSSFRKRSLLPPMQKRCLTGIRS